MGDGMAFKWNNLWLRRLGKILPLLGVLCTIVPLQAWDLSSLWRSFFWGLWDEIHVARLFQVLWQRIVARAQKGRCGSSQLYQRSFFLLLWCGEGPSCALGRIDQLCRSSGYWSSKDLFWRSFLVTFGKLSFCSRCQVLCLADGRTAFWQFGIWKPILRMNRVVVNSY